MSDPAKSTEIEDVLASIRKLVSVDPTAKLKDGPSRQKLVLTSDLRVGPNGADGPEAQDPLVLTATTDTGLGPEEMTESIRSTPGFEIVTETPRPAAPQGVSVDGAGGSDTPKIEAKPVVTKNGLIEPEEATVARDASETQSDALVAGQQIRANGSPEAQSDSLEARIAALEAAVASQSLDFEPDGSEDLTQHRPERVPGGRGSAASQPAENDDAETLVARFVRHERANDPDAAASDVSSDSVDPRLTAEPKSEQQDFAGASAMPEDEFDFVSRRSGAAGESSDEVADGDVETFDPAIPNAGVAHSRGAEATDDIDVGSTDEVAPDEPSVSSRGAEADDDADEEVADNVMLDEAALRDLVSEIVRSELQGALGERITRNVRKLVRREIMRAISVRDTS